MEIQINQDIRKFKTKDIGNFSFKEAGFLAVACAAGFVVYKLANSYEPAIPIMGAILIFGFFKPFGLTFMQFIKTVLKENVFTPKVYLWETDFEYEPDEFEKIYGEPIQLSTEWSVIQTTTEKIDKEQLKDESSRIIP